MKPCREAVGQVGNQDVDVLDRTCHSSHVRDVKDRSQIRLRVRDAQQPVEMSATTTRFSRPPREIPRDGSLHLRTNTNQAWIGCYRIGRQLFRKGSCVVWSDYSSSQQANSSYQIAEDGNRHSRSNDFPSAFGEAAIPVANIIVARLLGPLWSMAVAAAPRTGQRLQK